MPHKFSPHSIERLLRPDRLGDTTPDVFLKGIGLKPGMSVADVGSGPGFFTLPAASIVGPSGIVYAIDTQPEMLVELRKTEKVARQVNAARIIKILSGEHSIPLRHDCVDLALVVYILHEATTKRGFLSETARILRPGGRLCLIDWDKIKEDRGPPVWDRIEREEAAELVRASGLTDVTISSFMNSNYRIDAIKK